MDCRFWDGLKHAGYMLLKSFLTLKGFLFLLAVSEDTTYLINPGGADEKVHAQQVVILGNDDH